MSDLRTDLEAAINRADPPGGMRSGTPSISVTVLRTLLAAHPAPEAQEPADMRLTEDGWLYEQKDKCDCSSYYGAHEITCATEPVVHLSTLPGWAEMIAVAAVAHFTVREDGTVAQNVALSDTRREDVARKLMEHRYRYLDAMPVWHELPTSHREAYLTQADAALAVLPAPPVVDGASPAPWSFQHWGEQNQNGDCGELILFDANGEAMVYGLSDADGVLIVALRNAAPPVVDVAAIREFIVEEVGFDNGAGMTDQAERLAARLRGATRG